MKKTLRNIAPDIATHSGKKLKKLTAKYRKVIHKGTQQMILLALGISQTFRPSDIHTNYKKMKKNILEKTILVFMLLSTIYSFSTIMAQEVVPAAGGNASGDGGSVSYSIGQLTYQLHSGTSGSVAEGIQIPYEITVVTAIGEFPAINLVVSAYPNPTTDYLTLQVNDYAGSDLSYFLYDMQGKLLHQENISDSHTSIYLGDLVPAVYFVKVMQPNREMKTFKIVKN